MAMNDVLREKRKFLGLTQEQVANYLGITTPAVNKWEKGTTCPDITLLPALARLLKTDPNTLLSFQENLSKQEILAFQQELANAIREKGMEEAFLLALEKARDFPNCAELAHTTALFLEGGLIMSGLTEEQKKPYFAKTTALFESAANSDDPEIADSARFMLASRHIQKEQYAQAQKMLDRLPAHSNMDKRGMQATIWAKEGKTAEAAALLERKILWNLQDNLATLSQLVKLNMTEGNHQAAQQLAAAAQAECEAFGLWQFSAYVVPWEAAVACKEVERSLAALEKLLEAIAAPYSVEGSPLYGHIPHGEMKDDMKSKMLTALVTALDHDPDFAFLRGNPAFQRLMEPYQRKCD